MRKAVAILMLWLLGCGWISAQQQHFPYNVSVQTIPGHCYDDTHLIFTLTDADGNEIQINPQTHNAANTAQYPLYNVRYHYQNNASGSVQYDYNNDILLAAGTYCVGVTANVPIQGGYALVDTTICNVQIATLYNYLETNALSNLSYDDYDSVERYGFRASFHCADVGRIQLRIVQGSFPYTVTILDEQQDTVRHAVFYHRVNSGNNPYAANYRDYYSFDSLPIGTYSIYVSDSCGYTVPLTFSIPDYEPTRYLASVKSDLSGCLDETVVPFRVERLYPSGISAMWCNYNYAYMDSILMYRFINPGGDTTEWKNIVTPGYVATDVSVYDTFPSYCDIFYDTIKMQLHDLCHDTLMTYSFRFLPQFGFSDSMIVVYQQDTIIHDTCATHLPNGVSTQTYKIWGSTWTGAGKRIYGSSYNANPVPFRYYRCPLSYNIWSLPDSTLLGHDQSNEFTGLGTWETYFADTSLHVYVSVTDAQGCTLVDKDTVLVYQTEPVEELLFWFECHNDKDDDGKDHCCADRYLWIQEHGVDANTFRRNMTLRLIESPLYNQFNFTAIRQNGVWTVTPDDPNNHSTYLEFSYEDGWRATVRDSVCLPPGRYTFEVSTDCGVDTITYSWAGYYYDTLYFVSAPQYEMQQLCGDIVFTQISTGFVNYMYFIDPEVSNDIPEETIPNHVCSSYSPEGGSDHKDSQGRNVLVFSIPGTYSITTYAYNWPYTNCTDWCSDYQYHYDTLIVAFSHLDFDMVSAWMCGSSSETGVVFAQAINGKPPYDYMLYDQSGAFIASNSSGLFEDVHMTIGQSFTVQVTDSCSTSFSINVTAAMLTYESLLWEQGPNAAQTHCIGDSVHLTAFTFPPPATYHWMGPNGFSSNSQTNDFVIPQNGESGWYKVEILNSICGPIITDSVYVSVAPMPQVTIAGDESVTYGDSVTLLATSTTGGLTYLWNTGDTTPAITVTPVQITEYTVTVTTSEGCTGTASKIVAIEAPASISTQVFLCSGTSDTLTARAATAYLWSTGDTTQSLIVSEAGFYRVTAMFVGGSFVVDTFKVTTVKVNSVSEIDFPEMCAGGVYPITVGYVSSCNLIFQTHETVLALNDTVFLPDGKPCGDPPSCSYRSALHFGGYEDTAHVNSVNDIRYVRLNLEHSWSGDIYINLTCPNGQKSDILKMGNDYAYSICVSNIPASSRGWTDGDNAIEWTFFGQANDSWNNVAPCDASQILNAPGVGWNYCWSNNYLENYQYAPGDGLIYRYDNVIEVDGYEIYDSSNVAEGTQFYHPDESFESLVGCPLNGDWYIEVMDGSTVDNGYIFGWELALAEDIQEVVYADVVQTTVEGPWVTATSDSSFIFAPPADLSHDTVVNYLFHCYNEYDCGFDTVVDILFYARSFTDTTFTACDSFVWNGVTYTFDTTLTDTLTNIHGCDSLFTVNIHLIPPPSVTIVGPQFLCVGDSVTLTVSTDAEPQYYLWSNGATGSSITVADAGQYTVTAYFAGGCSAESSVFQLFESESPILDAHLSDMMAGDTQTVVIGTMVGDNLQYAPLQSTLTYSTVTFLPDGVPCEPLGCSYKAEMLFSGFPDTAVIQSVEDIHYIRLNMEHSALIDLYISLECPNGQQADILKKCHGSSISDCLSFIDASHMGWPSGNVNTVYNLHWPYKLTWLGNPNIIPSGNNANYRCDSTKNKPGVGWNYCWSNNTTQGYQYASGDGHLVDTSNAILYYNGTATLSHLQKIIIDSSNIAAGSQFYHPDVSFNNLVGCPVNGTWTIEVIDGIVNDNGYIFESELSLADYLIGSHHTSLIQVDFDSMWVTRLTDSTFIITPPEDLANDTVVGYTFTLTDENGCVFDTTIYITIYVRRHVDLYETVYADELPYEWNGLTFTGAGCRASVQCDSIYVLHLIVMHLSVMYPYDTAVCENGMPVYWHGKSFSGADTVEVSYSLDCADSIEVLGLRVNPTYLLTADSAVCENQLPCIWRGKSLYTSDIYYDTLVSSSGCDSVYRLDFTVREVFRDTTEYAVCANAVPYVWRNQSFYTSGTYYDSLTSSVQCDSIYVLHLTVNDVFRDTVEVAVCDNDLPYSWHNRDISIPGTYCDTLTSSLGCDSLYVLNFTVREVFRDTSDYAACANELPYQWRGRDLSISGTYYDSLTSSTLCDSIYMLYFMVKEVFRDTTEHAVCANAVPYVWRNRTFYTSGTYYDSLTSSVQCDSIYVLHLTVKEVVRDTAAHTVCNNDLPYSWHNQDISIPGTYRDTLTSSLGCDSIFVMVLTVKDTTFSNLYDTVLQNAMPYTLNGVVYPSAGVYVQHRENSAGCDSTITLYLTVLENVRMELDTAVCDSLLPVIWNGITFTEAGTDSVLLEASSGADSTVVMTVAVKSSTSYTSVVSIVENDLPYLINGVSYDTAGTYTQHLPNAAGCDSLLTIHLIVANNIVTYKSATICDYMLPASWQGHIWYGPGVIIDTFATVSGADSIVVKTLYVGTSSSSEIYDTILENNLPYQLNSYDYYETDDYVQHRINNAGCDSAITLHLTVLLNQRTELDSTVCDSLLPMEWNGITFTEAGTDSVRLEASNGVDSTVVMTVNVKSSSDSMLIVSVIENNLPYVLNGFEYSASGIHTQNLDNAVGCDSTLTLVLTLLYNVRMEVDSMVCDSLLPISWNGVEFTAAGTDSVTILATSGVDSTVVMTLTVAYPTYGTYADTVVENSLPYSLNGYTYDTAGVYTQHLVNANGCDSTITFTLTVFYNVSSEVDSIVCPSSLPLVWNGKTFTEAGEQSAVLTAANGADSIVTMTVTLWPSPVAHISGSPVLCTDAVNTLTADSAVAYAWNTGDTTQSIEVNTPGIYTVTVTDERGCTATDEFQILGTATVDALSAIHLYDLCVGNSYTFTAGYQATDNFVIDGNEETHPVTVTLEGPWATIVDTATFVVSPPADLQHDTTVVYTIHIYDDYGCGYDTTVNLNIYVPVYAVIDTVVCDSFVWNGATYTQTGVYLDTLTSAAGCDSLVTLNLTVNYSYLNHDTLLLLQNQLPYHFVPSDTIFPYGSPAEFQFSYTLAAQNGCDSVILEKVYVYMNYTQSFDTMVCADALPLTWHGHTFTTAATVTDSLYTVHGSDSLLIYTVTVDVLGATIGNVTPINCFGESTGAATATVTGGTSPLTYQWTDGAGASVSSTTQISNRPTGDYTFTVTDAAGCLATASVTLNTQHGQMLPGDISGPQTVCFGDTIGTIIGTAATGDGCSYQWQTSTDGTSWSPLPGTSNTQNYTFQTPVTSSFLLRRAWISPDCGTLYSDTLDISVWPVTSDTIYDEVCVGTPYQDHGFNISETETVGLGTLTSWIHYTSIHGCDSVLTLILDIHDPQEMVISAEVCEGVGYYANGFAIPASETMGVDTLLRVLNLQTVDGCDSVVRLEVAVIDTALRIVSPTADFCEDMSAELMAVTHMTDYEWSTGEQTPNITVTAPGIYRVTASQNDCSATAQYVIERCVYQFYLPNVITPARGDGLNDYFFIPEQFKGSINMFEISIFNRWGGLVFYSTDKNFQWNGEYKGQIYHQAVYNYVIEYTDYAGRPFRMTGSITVL